MSGYLEPHVERECEQWIRVRSCPHYWLEGPAPREKRRRELGPATPEDELSDEPAEAATVDGAGEDGSDAAVEALPKLASLPSETSESVSMSSPLGSLGAVERLPSETSESVSMSSRKATVGDIRVPLNVLPVRLPGSSRKTKKRSQSNLFCCASFEFSCWISSAAKQTRNAKTQIYQRIGGLPLSSRVASVTPSKV